MLSDPNANVLVPVRDTARAPRLVTISVYTSLADRRMEQLTTGSFGVPQTRLMDTGVAAVPGGKATWETWDCAGWTSTSGNRRSRGCQSSGCWTEHPRHMGEPVRWPHVRGSRGH